VNESVVQFYDELASDYHYIYADWKASIQRQSKALHALLQGAMQPPPRILLDCSCGIGTQAIGLAQLGYEVHATDLSSKAIDRAQVEAAKAGVTIQFGVADLRSLKTQVEGIFDVVLSCDNALPHLLTNADLDLAFQHIRAKLKPKGLFLASLRDYDELIQSRPRSSLPQVVEGAEGRHIIFQVWDWAADGQSYQLHLFLLRQVGSSWQTVERVTRYRALLREELTERLRQAGFGEVHWYLPEQSGFFQPVVVAC
jgi:SAM-dependent methyltransferase